jgi:hypothetical protein
MQHYTDPQLYDEIVKEWEYRFPKFNPLNYPTTPKATLEPRPKYPPDPKNV